MDQESGGTAVERRHTVDGAVILFEHDYDQGKNPFFDLAGGQAGLDGVYVVVGFFALFHSPRNLIRTETRVLGTEGVISVRTVEIPEYNGLGYPLRSTQELYNVHDPGSATVFEAEYE